MTKDQIIYGLHAIIEAIEADTPISKVYLQKGSQGELFSKLEGKIHNLKISVSYVPVQKLDKMINGNHQGAVAKISQVAFKNFEAIAEEVLQSKANPVFLLLDGITDVRNFGAIIRTAECTGVNAIVVGKSGSAPLNEDAIKTSAGAAFNIPICRVNHLKDAIYYLQASGITIVAATEKTDSLIYDVDFKSSVALILGAEGKGIASSILDLVDSKVKLPLLGKTESLNVSVACGAFLYEIVRQRQS